MNDERTRRAPYDVAVVGAGMAGLSAAIEASGDGRRVVLLDARQDDRGPRPDPSSTGWLRAERGRPRVVRRRRGDGLSARTRRRARRWRARRRPGIGVDGDAEGVFPATVGSLLRTPLLKGDRLAMAKLFVRLPRMRPMRFRRHVGRLDGAGPARHRSGGSTRRWRSSGSPPTTTIPRRRVPMPGSRQLQMTLRTVCATSTGGGSRWSTASRRSAAAVGWRSAPDARSTTCGRTAGVHLVSAGGDELERTTGGRRRFARSCGRVAGRRSRRSRGRGPTRPALPSSPRSTSDSPSRGPTVGRSRSGSTRPPTCRSTHRWQTWLRPATPWCTSCATSRATRTPTATATARRARRSSTGSSPSGGASPTTCRSALGSWRRTTSRRRHAGDSPVVPRWRCRVAEGVFVAGDWVGPEGVLVDASVASGRAAGSAAVTMTDVDRAEGFEEHRHHLFGVAYRMLGWRRRGRGCRPGGVAAVGRR